MDKERSSFSIQVVTAILLACLVTTLSVAFLGYMAVRQADHEAAVREMRFAIAGLAAEAERLPAQQQVSTIWNEAVLRVRAGDHDWIADNLGVWMLGYFGHDEEYVLGPRDRPVHAARDGATVQRGSETRLPPALEPLIRRLRRQLRPLVQEDARLAVVKGVMLGNRPAIASVVPILPDTQEVIQAPGSAFLHVAIKYADARMAQRIARTYELRRAEFLPAEPGGDRLSVPLRGIDGRPIVWFAWEPAHPGRALARTMAPIVAAFVLLGAALLAWLLRNLWHSSRRLHRSEAAARYLALHDPLAGVANRTLFEERLEAVLQSERQGGPPVAVICLDLDRFKMVNDTMGHPAGDELIRQVATRLRLHVRPTDTVARLGGDEFGVILIGVASDEALASFCGGLIHLLSAPYNLGTGQAHVTASIGAARAIHLAEDRDDLMRNADTALYRAKSEGRGRYGIFTPEMHEALRHRADVERDLREAIDRGDQFPVVYQPIFDVDDRLVGAEALVRWAHPRLGTLGPAAFIGIAEETGLIGPLGLLVLEQAAQLAVVAALPKVSVNVSPVQLRDDRFAGDVLAVLDRAGLAPETLELELTEAFALDPTRATFANLERLRGAGISIALDDFAIGQSLLRYVRDCRIDTIKIDRSFVSRLGLGDGTDQIVQAIVHLGRAMGLEVTAEGVENPAQREALAAMGCQGFQGFLLARPMDPVRLTALTTRQPQPRRA